MQVNRDYVDNAEEHMLDLRWGFGFFDQLKGLMIWLTALDTPLLVIVCSQFTTTKYEIIKKT